MRSLLGIIFGLIWASTGAFAGPTRVVSMNLCTDQLAMLLAAPGQLISVSYIARDTRASAMARDAMAYPINHGLAEEIYLLKPDLVIAGAYSTRATTDMLRRLGIPIAVFQPANSLKDVRDRIQQMGDVLGRETAAHSLLADYDAKLSALKLPTDTRPSAALYSANGYTSGPKSLAGQILDAAGFDNVATTLGYTYSGQMPLEVLAIADPDLLVSSAPYPGASRSEDILSHPVVRHLTARSGRTQIRDADWVCGTPHVLGAIVDLAEEHDHMTGGNE